ncbi:MAG: hypothetical protein LBP19_06545 [Treponema sp.]|jgi:hypothetical protein|nr:hypothetical protein [Treponema sp.]
MDIKDKICRVLKTLEFEPYTEEDNGLIFKGLIPDEIALYFKKGNGNEVPCFGIWMENEDWNTMLRDKLKDELQRCVCSNKYGKLEEVKIDKEGIWIYCTITDKSASVIDWIIAAAEELEHRGKYIIRRYLQEME